MLGVVGYLVNMDVDLGKTRSIGEMKTLIETEEEIPMQNSDLCLYEQKLDDDYELKKLPTDWTLTICNKRRNLRVPYDAHVPLLV